MKLEALADYKIVYRVVDEKPEVTWK